MIVEAEPISNFSVCKANDQHTSFVGMQRDASERAVKARGFVKRNLGSSLFLSIKVC